MNRRISFVKILSALIGGAIGWFLGEILYAALIDQVWKPLVVALFFLVLAAAVCLCLLAASKITGDLDYFMNNPINHDTFKRLLPVALIAVFLGSMLLEFLYELGGDLWAPEPTSYIFALDISSSMTVTDPNNQEAEAVKKIIGQMDDDFPFAVYTFATNVERVEEMHRKTKEDNDKERKFEYEGSTSMYGVLDQIISDYQDGQNNSNWVGGDSPRIILVSDGSPTDGDLFGQRSYDIARSCRDKGVSICGISVVGADQELMKKLSENTGGKSFSINDIDNLYDSLSSALTARSFGNRTLISYRGFVHSDILYCLMRILFIAVIVCLYSMVIYPANAFYDDLRIIVVMKCVTAVISGCYVEFSIQAFLGSEWISRLALCLLISACILHRICSSVRSSGTESSSANDGHIRSGNTNDTSEILDLSENGKKK